MIPLRSPFRRLYLPALALTCAGCGTNAGNVINHITQIANAINDAVNNIQQEDPRNIDLPGDAGQRGDTVIVNQNATVITNVSSQLTADELPDINLIGIENVTSADIYVRFFVDGDEQAVFVRQGDTLLLQYNCVSQIVLDSEDDFDPFTGDFLDSFDLSSTELDNPADFECGDAVIISIDDTGVLANTQLIALD